MRTNLLRTILALLNTTWLLTPALAQGELRLRCAPGSAGGELRVGLRGDGAAASQFDAVLPSPGQPATGAPFVAANLFDTASRAHAGALSVALSTAGTRVLVTGVVDPSRAGAGRIAEEPVAKLREVLAGSDAQVVVVLTDLDRNAALQLLREVPQATLILQRAGTLADRRPAELDGRFVMPWPDDGLARRFVATLQDGKLKAPRLELMSPDPAQALLPLQQLLQGAGAPQPAAATVRRARSRAVELQVHDARVAASYGDRQGPCVVVDAEFTNILPLEFVYDRKVPVAWQVPRLQDHVYLVVDGTRLLRLWPDAEVLAGHLMAPQFQLARLGEQQRGNLVFPLPAGLRPEATTALELRVYDFAHGHLMLPLGGPPPAAAAPMTPLQRNEVVELGVYGLERREQLAGAAAPAGMEWIVVDVRARSSFTVDADATAFDPKAKVGQRLLIGTVADWTDAQRYLQLVVDGAVGFAPVGTAFDLALPAAPRFLPDLATGGLVAFLAPAAASSLQLRCDFPNAKSSLGGAPMRPKGFTVAVAGEPPVLAELPVLAGVKDSQFDVRVLAQQAVAAFGGEPAGDGMSFLCCELEIRNLGKDGEFFQTKAQLQLATADGKLTPLDPVSARGPRPALELLWIPPLERRQCTAVYRVAAAADRLRLAYASVDAGGARMLALPPRAAVVATTPTTPVQPPATDPAAPPPAPAPVVAKAPVTPPPSRPAATKPKAAVPELPRVPIHGDRTPRGIEGVGLTAAQVNTSIDRGCVALWDFLTSGRRQRIELGNGEYVLGALALVHAGFHKKDAEFDATVRAFLERREPPDGTYAAGLIGMLIEAYGDPEFLPRLRINTEWLVNSQLSDGTWGYYQPTGKGLPPYFTPLPPPPPAVLRSESSVDRTALLAPIVRHPDMPEHPGGGDNSVTQYALLGLDAAVRLGLPVPEQVWRKALQITRERQCRSGAWDYNSTSAAGYGSMTAAGVCAVAFANHHLGLPLAGDELIEQGLAWLERNFSVKSNPNSAQWVFYWLYSLERVGRLLDTEFVGVHEWYPIGARQLVDTQLSNGLWKPPTEHEALATPFALLFLTRATPKLKAEAPTGPGQLLTKVIQPPGRKLYVILDASGSMLEEVAGRTKFDIARAALGELVQGLPDATEVALRVYGHRKRAIEEGADEDCELVLPMGRLDKPKFAKVLAALRPRGKTPLALSLEQSLGQVTAGTTKEPLTLLLLTDGGEDTKARRDPVAVAKQLAKITNLRFRVVGFDIERETWQKQLAAMTAAGNGRYVPALRTQSLLEALRLAALDVPSGWVLLDATGAEAGRGKFGDSLTLPPGDYVFRTTRGDQVLETKVVIRPAGTARVTFDPNG